jgi:trehalose 6-phosphate synthase
MLVVSNRGPYRFERGPDGSFVPRPGAGGVASALTPLLQGLPEPTTWVAGALSADDRAAAAAGAADGVLLDGVLLELVDVEPRLGRLYYDVVSNATLWFLHHGLFDLPRRPRFDHRWREAWAAYIEVNEGFAQRAAAVAADGDVVLVHDYQLSLVPGVLRAIRPDLRIVHFSHTPFCEPGSIRVLPHDVAFALFSSMATVPCGFHTARWARAYEASAGAVLGPDAALAGAFAAPLAPDAPALHAVAASPESLAAAAELDELIGDRALLLRTDRIEPAKNVVRGFLAYDRLLELHPEWRERVVFVAMLNASREGLAEYLAYHQEVRQAAEQVNRRWATGGWLPVVLDERDDFARSVAGLGRYDVLLVNSLKDGMNLVAKEGPLLNRRDGVVCLSTEAGAYDELYDAVLAVHPYDIDQGADVLHRALAMPRDERAALASRLRGLAGARTTRDWLDDLVRQAEAGAR